MLKRIGVLLVIGSMLTGGLNAQGSSSAPGQAKRSVGVLIFDVNMDRLSPRSLDAEEGWYLLRVRNGVTFRELTVSLERDTGKVLELTAPKQKAGAERPVELHSGTYTLKVGSNPAWTATINVTKKSK